MGELTEGVRPEDSEFTLGGHGGYQDQPDGVADAQDHQPVVAKLSQLLCGGSAIYWLALTSVITVCSTERVNLFLLINNNLEGLRDGQD